MTQVSDVKNILTSGLTYIDSLLDNGPGWNYLAPATNNLTYTFSIASGNESGQTGQQAFSSTQKTATLNALSYISNLTGITFSETANPSAANIHFCMINIPGASTSGLCSWHSSYSSNPSTNAIVSYSATAYVYLDNVEWLAQNSNLTPGGNGYETLLHEMGHALGLKHPFEGSAILPSPQDNTANTLMSYTRSGGPYASFNSYDLAAINWLYGGDGLGGALGVGSTGGGRYWTGTNNADAIIAGSSNDLLKGEAGNDTLTGGAGNDTIFGGDGSDTAIFSGSFASYTYSYNASTDTFSLSNAATGKDSVNGVETFQFSDGAKTASQLQTGSTNTSDTTAPFFSNLSPADNATDVAASANLVLTFNEAVKAGSGNFIIFNADGTVAKTIAVSDASQVSISGGSVTINPSADLAAGNSYYVNAANGVIKDLAGNNFAGITGTTAYNFTVVAAATKTLNGTVGNDYYLYGTSAADEINGLAGNDALYGLDGNDTLNGGTGYDYLVGGNGDDMLDGGADIDAVDYYTYDTLGPISVDLALGTATGAGIGSDRLTSIEIVYGGFYADTLIGDANTNYLCGIDGNDKIDGAGGDDSLWGWTGNDTLIGGAGNDLLYGSYGADTFYFAANQGTDTIEDFYALEDKITIASGTNGITTPAQAFSHLITNSIGSVVLDLGQGNTVILLGVPALSLNSSMFTIIV